VAATGKTLHSRVLAQSSIRQGGHAWLIERITSVALIPLGLWFVVSAVGLAGAGYDEVRAWLSGTFNTVAMLLLIVTAFWHAQLGAHVILEDYIHHRATKVASLVAVDFVAIALGLASAVAVLKVYLGS